MSHSADREGSSPAERGSAPEGCEVRPGARRVIPSGLAPIAAKRVKMRVEPRAIASYAHTGVGGFSFSPREGVKEVTPIV